MKALLRDNSEMAFTVSEICDMLGERGGNALLEVVEQILLDLIREESVERKEIGGVLYYSYKTRPLGFRRG